LLDKLDKSMTALTTTVTAATSRTDKEVAELLAPPGVQATQASPSGQSFLGTSSPSSTGAAAPITDPFSLLQWLVGQATTAAQQQADRQDKLREKFVAALNGFLWPPYDCVVVAKPDLSSSLCPSKDASTPPQQSTPPNAAPNTPQTPAK